MSISPQLGPWVIVAIALALFVGCNDGIVTGPIPVPTPTPAPSICPFIMTTRPLLVPGAWFVIAEPPGPFTAIVGATIYGGPDEGVVVYGSSGDIVSACRPCGCAIPVPLR